MRIKVKIKKQRRRTGSGRNSNYVAMGTLLAYSALGAPQALPAQTPVAGGGSPSAGQTLAVVRFEISAGALADAILAFEKASGWKVEIPNEKMLTLTSK